MLNIDFLVSGCNTRCKHCYVNGGPGPMMPVEDAILCIEKLDETAKYIAQETSFTLDHEPLNHPQIDEILYAASHTKNISNFHHGMTTGLGLMHRKDKEAVVKSYLDNGYREFGITIHGAATHHDEITGRKGAFDAAVAAAKFLKDMGCNVQVSLMLNKFFAEDADEISRLPDELKADDVWFANPIFTPHSNMMAFEPYRATLETVYAISQHLSRWRQNEREVTESAYKNSVGTVIERIQDIDLNSLWAEEQTELYLSLHHDCKLYVGNSGAETELLGDLRSLCPEETAQVINALPGNRDYGAFYDAADLLDKDDVRKVLAALPQNLVYGDLESVIYRAFTELGVPTKLLKLS